MESSKYNRSLEEYLSSILNIDPLVLCKLVSNTLVKELNLNEKDFKHAKEEYYRETKNLDFFYANEPPPDTWSSWAGYTLWRENGCPDITKKTGKNGKISINDVRFVLGTIKYNGSNHPFDSYYTFSIAKRQGVDIKDMLTKLSISGDKKMTRNDLDRYTRDKSSTGTGAGASEATDTTKAISTMTSATDKQSAFKNLVTVPTTNDDSNEEYDEEESEIISEDE